MNTTARPKLGASLGKIWRFIESEAAAGRPVPSAAAVAAHMRWQSRAAGHDALLSLAGQGYLIGTPPGRGGKWTFALADAASSEPAPQQQGCVTSADSRDDDPTDVLAIPYGPAPGQVVTVVPTLELLRAVEARVGAVRTFVLRLGAVRVTSAEVEQTFAILLAHAGVGPEGRPGVEQIRAWMEDFGLADVAQKLGAELIMLIFGRHERRTFRATPALPAADAENGFHRQVELQAKLAALDRDGAPIN